MKIEIEDVLFWMDAIRNSNDRYRTLESFWKGQINSKIWLIENLEKTFPQYHKERLITIYGGWNGVLASLIFNSNINVQKIQSIDIDPSCKDIANTINKRYEIQGKFEAVTADMCDYKTDADIVINTSCEHISQDQYDIWLDNIAPGTKIVLQSNNYFALDEHIRCVNSMEEFISQSNVHVSYVGEFTTALYTRYMIIGKKYG